MAIKDLNKVKTHLFLCNGGSCTKKGAIDNTIKIREYIQSAGLHDEIHTTKTFCNGRCGEAPVMIVMPEGTWYGHVNPDFSKKFVRQQLVEGCEMKENRLFIYGGDLIKDEL